MARVPVSPADLTWLSMLSATEARFERMPEAWRTLAFAQACWCAGRSSMGTMLRDLFQSSMSERVPGGP
ncbi:MAG: hypothetical protein IPF99_29705 [Deltaproteobacteria bacterium]|nr:hypothetical protein [Deltaproteobacteria bacterium]